MKKITREECNEIIVGGTLLGTGGGADPVRGKQLIEKVQNLNLCSLDELNDDDYVFCIFMIGSSGMEEQSSSGVLLAKQNFFKLCNRSFKGIIPVELGGGALGETLFIANELKLPIIDADVVGGRAAPEVFLETITLRGIARTPLVVANNNGDVASLTNSNDYLFVEKFLRSFATQSGGIAYVCGYPLRVGDIKGVVAEESVTRCMELGKKMTSGKYEEIASENIFSFIAEGIVTSVTTENLDGFLQGEYTIQSGKDTFEITIKNENIICKKNEKTIVTVPDLICLYNLETNEGVYNRDIVLGLKVAILSAPAIPIWRTPEGIKLFSPKNLGFNEETVLLEREK